MQSPRDQGALPALSASPSPAPSRLPSHPKEPAALPQGGQRPPPAPSPHGLLHLPPSLWRTPSHSARPLTCGLPLAPVLLHLVLREAPAKVQKGRWADAGEGGCHSGSAGPGRTRGGAVGAGPPFHPKERGPPTKHSLLLSHSTNEVSDRRRRKQAATFWRNRDQVRARRLRPSPAARAGTPPPCSPPPPASTRHSCSPAGGHGLPWALRAQKAPLWSARRCPRPAGGERPVHLCRVAGLTSEWAPGP